MCAPAASRRIDCGLTAAVNFLWGWGCVKAADARRFHKPSCVHRLKVVGVEVTWRFARRGVALPCFGGAAGRVEGARAVISGARGAGARSTPFDGAVGGGCGSGVSPFASSFGWWGGVVWGVPGGWWRAFGFVVAGCAVPRAPFFVVAVGRLVLVVRCWGAWSFVGGRGRGGMYVLGPARERCRSCAVACTGSCARTYPHTPSSPLATIPRCPSPSVFLVPGCSWSLGVPGLLVFLVVTGCCATSVVGWASRRGFSCLLGVAPRCPWP